jgi:adenylosuccinate synthase
MAKKKRKVTTAGAGAYGAARAARDNPYVSRLIEDDELRDNLRTAFDSARKAYSRMNGRGPVRALTDDKKVQKELKEAASSLREAADALRGGKSRRRRRPGRMLMLLVVGAGLALVLSEGLRKKALDALFGAEEEFEYTSTTSPASTASEPVGSASS